MEINTSTLPELAAWCRSLGLSEGGTKADLVSRLRAHFILPLPAGEEEDTRKIITIESARSTQYFKLEVVDEEYARLTGDVRVSLKDTDATHRIKAREILFNRTRNILTASGGVEYIKEQEDTVETFRGDSITVNLDNWSSVFLNGVSERSVPNESTSFRFAGNVISRNEQEVTILSKSSISNGKNPEAYWSLEASRVWLLPGSDFAIFNAVLKVGEIPVLYIPFFYYPADEMVFHPVIGYRSREGNFVQTTTYILGRPKASSSSESSLTKILGNSSDMERKLEGLFLRSTGKKVKDPNTTSLKAMVDYYTNLGAHLGAELNTPRYGILNPIDLSFGLGFTRTLVPITTGYTPFAPDYDGSSDWNSSNLFSVEVPFRYRFKLDTSINGKYGNLSLNFPYYSDPWVDRDFMNRAESMDWVNMVQQGAALEEEEVTETLLGDYQWQLSGSLNPSISQLSPYITSFAVSSITSTMSFKQLQSQESLKYPNTDPRGREPNTYFFAPDRLTIYNISGVISGTPLTLEPGGLNRNAGTAKTETPVEDPLKNIGVPRAPWEEADAGAAQGGKNSDKLVPPALNQTFSFSSGGAPRFSIDYRISPTSSSELQFRSDNWKEYHDIDWNEVSSILSTFGGDASTTFNLNHIDGLYSNAFVFSGNGAWRQYSFLNEEAFPTVTPGINPLSDIRKQQYSQSFFSTSYGYTYTLRPLYRNEMWGQSNIQYSLRGRIAKSKFLTSSTGDNPEWDIEYGGWDKDNIDTHQLATNITASVLDKTQNVTFAADMPPRETALSGNATFRAWITETNAQMRVRHPEKENRWRYEPFYATNTIRFGNFGSFVNYIILDTELKELTTFTSTLNLWGLRAQYAAYHTEGYEFSSSRQDWVLSSGDKSLKPKDFTLGYTGNFAKSELWGNRLKFSVNLNSNLLFDLQRYTSSSFSQTLGFTLGINGFVDLSLSATSENAEIYRYLQDIPMFELPILYPGEKNVFKDLANSFRFDDDDYRRSSAFKLKNFKLSANHHLGDWNAILDITMSPYLTTSAPIQYQLNTEFAFLVQWVPVGEIKSDIKYDKKTDKWVIQ
ncbi:MAG: LPS-assembly protein LptD [Treponema sp.]|nr:LPS-assembly protein LptD [Treponema sp.]